MFSLADSGLSVPTRQLFRGALLMCWLQEETTVTFFIYTTSKDCLWELRVLRVPSLLSLYWTVVVDSVVTNTSVDFEARAL